MSSEAREWHEIVEDEEEIRPSGPRGILVAPPHDEPDGKWHWKKGKRWYGWEEPTIAHALCRDKSCDWLERHSIAILDNGCGRYQAFQMVGAFEPLVVIAGFSSTDRDTCIRLAVDAVLRGKA